MILRSAGVAGALVAVLVAAGCGGGDDDTSASVTWADGVCRAVGTWQDSMTKAVEPLKQGDISSETLETVASDLRSATTALTDDVKALGQPETESGAAVKQSLQALGTQVATGMQEMQSAVDGASGVSGVVTAVTTITATLATVRTQVQSTFDDLSETDAKGELKDAFGKAGSCDDLQGD